MTRYARTERVALADLLLRVGPDAPTRCAGWQAADLAAHIVVRDRRPDAAAGVLVPALSGHTDRLRRQVRDGTDFPGLVAKVRNPPWWSPAALPPVDRAANTVEFFVHHEDVRRCQDGWAPRQLPADQVAELWRWATRTLRLGLRRFPASVVVSAPGQGELRTGRGGPEVRLSGEPGELLLFGSGRQDAARVEISGPDELTARLRTMRLGV